LTRRAAPRRAVRESNKPGQRAGFCRIMRDVNRSHVHWSMNAAARVAAGMALLLAGAPALASDVEIKVGKSCKAGVEIVARNAPLSAVLERLSRALAFKLDGQPSADTLVNLRATAPATELIEMLLAAQERVMVSHARDPRCPGGTRVTRVWLFGTGQQLAAGTKPAAAKKPPAPQPIAATRDALALIATPAQLREQEEHSRKRKEEYDAFVARHGEPPPGEEEEAAKP
jgi:hypothetical protein